MWVCLFTGGEVTTPRFTQYFRGSLSGLTIRPGKIATQKVISCLQACKEGLDISSLESLGKGIKVHAHTHIGIHICKALDGKIIGITFFVHLYNIIWIYLRILWHQSFPALIYSSICKCVDLFIRSFALSFFFLFLIMKILTLSWSLSVPLQPGSVSAGHGGRWLGEHQHSHDKSFLHQLSAVSHSWAAQTPHNHHSPVSTALKVKNITTSAHKVFNRLIMLQVWEWILVSIACILGVLFKSLVL